MEPISILTSVSAASRAALALSTTIFGFVQATRNVDQTVRALYDEVTGLNRTLDSISNRVKTADMKRAELVQHNHELWKSVAASLGDCRGALDTMRQALQNVKQNGSNVAAQALRVFRLNWKEDQIKTLRSQIQSHNTALQLALQTINVHLTSIAPRVVIEDLVPRFEMLADMIMQLSTQNLDNANQTPPVLAKEQLSMANLVISAKEVLYKAKSTIAESDGGSDNSSVITAVLNRLDLLDADQEVQPSVPIAGQGIGLWPRAEQRRIVEDWIPFLPSGSTLNQFDSGSATTRTQMTPTQSTLAMSTFGVEPLLTDEESEDDEEFEYEILQGYLDKGFASYNNGDWEIAEPYIRRAIDTSKTLPLDKVIVKGIDMAEAQFKIAVCAFHQNKLDEADVELFQLRMTRSAPDEPRNTTLRRILSLYLFAEICFQKNRLEEAHKYCRKALSMKRKLVGRTNWLETNCFCLLSAISAAQGDNITAEVYQYKAKASDSPDSSMEQDPEIRAARIDNLVSSRGRAGVDVKNIKIFVNGSTNEYLHFVDSETKDRHVAVYCYTIDWTRNLGHEVVGKGFAKCASRFPKQTFIHYQHPQNQPSSVPWSFVVYPKGSSNEAYIQIKDGSTDEERIKALEEAFKVRFV